MSTSIVQIVGDSSDILVRATNLTSPDPLEFISGSFRSSPEERRVVTMFLVTEGGAKVFELRIEFTSSQFVEHTITGAPVYTNTQDSLDTNAR